MATQLFLVSATNPTPLDWGTPLGITNDPVFGWLVDGGNAHGWLNSFVALDTARGNGAVNQSIPATAAGPTNPIRWQTCLSRPVTSSFTLSGTVTFNIWAAETNALANAGARVLVLRWRQADMSRAVVVDSARGVEFGTTRTAHNWTAAPTSTSFQPGDRIVAIVGIDDVGTMASGFAGNFAYNGTTGGADGDSFISFTENFAFDTGTPSGTKFFFRDTASSVSAGTDERELSRTAGTAGASSVTSTQAAPTSLIHCTKTAGGSVVEWYSPRLGPFTLSGKVKVNLWGQCGTIDFNAALICEIARVDSDGTNAVVWASDVVGELANTGIVLRTADSRLRNVMLAAPDLGFNGHRLRVRVYIEETWCDQIGNPVVPMEVGGTATFFYDDDTAAASGDSFIELTQTADDYVDPVPPTPPYAIPRPRIY